SVDDATMQLNEDTELIITLIGNDPDEDLLIFSIIDSPSDGTLFGDVPNLIYAPSPDYYGNDSFTFSASDGEYSDLGTVSITINPVNDQPTVPAVVFDGVTDEYQFTLDANDVDEDDLTISFTPEDGSTVFGGNITANADSTYTYSLGSTAEAFGVDYILYKALDGQFESGTGLVTFNISDTGSNFGNMRELSSFDQDISVAEDESITLTLSATDTDTLFDSVSTEIEISGPFHGSIDLSGEAIYDNFAYWEYVYEPDDNYFGIDSVEYRVKNPNNPEEWSDWSTVTITVNPVNDSPILAVADTSTAEDVPLTFTLAAI
ncbi:uncharacterized protein METZ01_LOCUS352720, partial [marine metagenome]